MTNTEAPAPSSPIFANFMLNVANSNYDDAVTAITKTTDAGTIANRLYALAAAEGQRMVWLRVVEDGSLEGGLLAATAMSSRTRSTSGARNEVETGRAEGARIALSQFMRDLSDADRALVLARVL